MADTVTLSAAVRESLLSLQNTSMLIQQTQARLSSGLRVESAIDDPVSFFQAKSLSDRAFDFSERKDAIDQGISTVTAALDGVEGIEELVRQLKGVVSSMKSATTTQMSDLITQFNDLRTQIDNLGNDSSFQGTNLIAGTGTSLSVEFSEQSASLLTINSVDITVSTAGLQVGSAIAFTGQFVGDFASASTNAINTGSFNVETGLTAGTTFAFTYEGGQNTFSTADSLLFTYGVDVLTVSVGGVNLLNKNDVINLSIATAATTGFYINATDTLNLVYQADSAANQAGTAITGAELFTLTYQGQTRTFTTANGPITFTLGGEAAVLTLGTAFGTGTTITQGGDIVVTALSAAALIAAQTGFMAAFSQFGVASGVIMNSASDSLTGAANIINGISGATGALVTADQGTNFINFVQAGDNVALNDVISTLDAALSTLRTQSQVLGTNVAVLQTRLDFTETYVNTLQAGASKLTLADLNEEGANLLALQTRQQLGIQALAFAGQAEQGILALFR